MIPRAIHDTEQGFSGDAMSDLVWVFIRFPFHHEEPPVEAAIVGQQIHEDHAEGTETSSSFL